MNGYVCFYRGKQIEVHAETTFDAQFKAAQIFKAKKQGEVRPFLAEKDGVPVVHSTASL